MHQFIALAKKDQIVNMKRFVEELESFGCVIADVHKDIGVITGDSPIDPAKIDIDGLTVEPDIPKQLIGDPEDDIQ